MVLGEFDFEENFIYDQVEEYKGSNISVQIIFVLFIFYGSMIIMNVITAWIVNNQKTAVDIDIILATQRIEEISGMTKITAVNSSYNVPPKLCISSSNESKYMTMFNELLTWFNIWLNNYDPYPNLLYSKVWNIKEHDKPDIDNASIKACEDANEKMFDMAFFELIDLTLKRLQKKKERKSELLSSIKEIQKETENKVMKLLENEEKQQKYNESVPEYSKANKEKNELWQQHCQQLIPKGSKMKGILVESQDGKLTMIPAESNMASN